MSIVCHKVGIDDQNPELGNNVFPIVIHNFFPTFNKILNTSLVEINRIDISSFSGLRTLIESKKVSKCSRFFT